MRIGGFLVLALALAAAGCNLVFGLEGPGGDGDGSGGDGGPDGDGPPADGRPDDLDSDGVLDGNDNCPAAFNPRQADEDGDAEINGGDACDRCPHRGSMPAGSPHDDADGDGLGDECDPDNTAWHCLRWFDGFGDGAGDVVLGRYVSLGGTWTVEPGAIVQSNALAAAAELVIADRTFIAPLIATQGRMDSLPTTGPTGMMPYRNTGGVLLTPIPGGPACFASVTRDVSGGIAGGAAAMLSTRSAGAELANATMFMGGGGVMMNPGERFGATPDGQVSPSYAVGALFDRFASQTVSVSVDCVPGGGGVRTSFAAMHFEYLLVVERGTVGVACPPRQPAPAP